MSEVVFIIEEKLAIIHQAVIDILRWRKQLGAAPQLTMTRLSNVSLTIYTVSHNYQ